MADWLVGGLVYVLVSGIVLAIMSHLGSGGRLQTFLFATTVAASVVGAAMLQGSELQSPVLFELRPGALVLLASAALGGVTTGLGIWLWRSRRVVFLFATTMFFSGFGVDEPVGPYVVAAAVVLLLVGIALLGLPRFSTDRDTHTRWLFEHYPRRRIGEWRDGELAVAIGRLACDAPAIAPLSRRSCVLAEYVVESLPAGTSFWVERERQLHLRDFTLNDGSGEALVIAAGGEVLLMKDFSADWQDHYLSHRRREGLAEVGELVAVFGRGNREPDPRPSRTAGYRDRPTVLVIRGTRRERLRVSDSPGITGRG